MKNEMGGTCSTYGRQKRCIQGLVGIREEYRPLGRPRRGYDYNIIWIFKRWVGDAWNGLIWLRIGASGRLF
jgi:hypothetical protein